MSNIQGNDDLVKTLTDLAATETLTLKDTQGVVTQYTTKPVYEVMSAASPIPGKVATVSLSGVVDLIQAELEGVKNEAGLYLIHVESPTLVTLKAVTSDSRGRRLLVIEASPVKYDQFPFGQFIDQEELVIKVASLFADTDDKNYVLDMASSLTSEAVTTHNDNGFVQSAVAKRGVRMKEAVTLKSRVTLAPYRTFPDIEQPKSEFVFRARCEEGQRPDLLLVEADGGKWKLSAMEEVARYLRTRVTLPVIA